MNQLFIAKTFKGLEEVLATELVTLGANNVEIQRRAVSFTGDKRLLYKANLHLRTAIRILKPIASFTARTPDEIYEEARKLTWTDFMDVNNTFAIDATVFSDEIRHSRFASYRMKDAIVDWFRETTGKRPSVKVDNPQLLFNLHISGDQCTLSLDSSGESLHKRGYRVNQTEAPISEVLAAGMLLLAGWDGQSDFVDPFCGSGTFLIEAAMIALNIPPGLYRPSFGFEQWSDFDKDLFDELYQDDSAERAFEHKIYGFDISAKALKIADENIKSAGVSKYITLERCDVAELTSPSENCLVVTNPPYGERLRPEELEPIYGALGSTLKHKFTGVTAWVISSEERLLERIGLKPSAKIQLMNGPLDCLFNKYEVFAGKRKEFLSTND
ncbi:MAG: THUMP domain-containing protein [Paludibacter sp.]|jgi:putative N6-adenine-specific DNA methylase|nr:THUMP domain-containing protein [Paludibacter sp.]